MSFSMSVKNNLCNIETEKLCCKKAELYGLLLFGRKFGGDGYILQTQNEEVCKRVTGLLNEVLELNPKIKKTPRKNPDEFTFLISVTGKKDTVRMLEFFGHSANEISITLNYANIEDECCFSAFLRGAFLSCGRVTSPSSNYHLEFSVSRMRLAGSFEKLISENFPSVLVSSRANSMLIYFKDSETIEDILTVMGATTSALEVMNVKVYKDLRNRVNRLSNCEAANLGKTVKASQEQIAAIKKIHAHGGTRHLAPELREMARLRLYNPSASLTELGKMAEPPVSRSGANHRMQRLLDLAKEIKE